MRTSLSRTTPAACSHWLSLNRVLNPKDAQSFGSGGTECRECESSSLFGATTLSNLKGQKYHTLQIIHSISQMVRTLVTGFIMIAGNIFKPDDMLSYVSSQFLTLVLKLALRLGEPQWLCDCMVWVVKERKGYNNPSVSGQTKLTKQKGNNQMDTYMTFMN